ncbi:hypothetical protein GXW77_08300 [Roseomonas alkaliterrae]|uniref:Flp pilus assembly protein TadG n=1 Tax=Neoroseomonas alkaliterrae TaxID=1452450 RepID=A0A840Y8V7_9PROT|nr:TadG family pilus assembly protein [Neoroseomonas alkaliterrae]MBB5690294.1 Flp pilus assembly protein TadG [Neoroseomonas alkaliterrae]MBR0676172.1 hypothetical protein [Neoroseomonas alkaliterrae]
MARTPAQRLNPAQRGRARRRGAVGAAMAVGLTAMLGMGALATEAGVWLTVRRNVQNAADAGAYAGISTLALRGPNAPLALSVDTVARDAVERNGFLAGRDGTSVTVRTGFWNESTRTFTSPAPAGNSPNAVRVEVTQPQPTALARLISATTPVAWGGATAIIAQGGPACTLTIPPPTTTSQVSGRTNIAGSSTVNAPECLMVANATGRRAINIQNNSAAQAATIGGLRSSGQCYNCNQVMGGNMPAGYSSNQAPTPNPYRHVDLAPMPSFNNAQCVEPTYLNASGQPTNRNGAVEIRLAAHTNPNTTPSATCTNVAIGAGQTLTLTPGTYYFNNASLSQTGGRIVCSGCSVGGAGVTIVLTGSNPNNVGNLRITGGEFNLNAPGPGFGTISAYDGIVLYRDDLGRVSNAANDSIKITGNPNSTIFGAIYAPTAHVELEGTGTMNQTPTPAGGCMAVVAGELTYSGNSAVNIAACEANGTAVTRIVYVRLAQ